MFGTTGREVEGSLRRLAFELWRQASGAVRHASLRIAMLLHGERVDPETLAVMLDGERHLVMSIWSQLAVEASTSPERTVGGQNAGASLDLAPLPGSGSASTVPRLP